MIANILAIETPQQAAKRLLKQTIGKGFKLEFLHPYTDLNGGVIYYRIRLKHPNGEKWIRPMHQNIKGMYQLGEPPEFKGTYKPLYNLSLIKLYPKADVYIVEGEYPADTLNQFFLNQNIMSKYIAITSGSASSADAADWQPLVGRKCILWPDKDEVGERYILKVASALMALGCKIKFIEINALELPEKGDCVDWINLNPNCDIKDLLAIPHSDALEAKNEPIEDKKMSQATELVAFVIERSDLFHDKNKDVFAMDKKSKEVRQIGGRQFHDFLTASFYEHTNNSIRDQSLREALSTLSGIGRYHGECRDIHRRVAKHEDCYYLDLCQEGNSRVIKISSGYWEITDAPPVRFIRPETMQPLPDPAQGGTLAALWQVCNIPKDSQLLTVAFLAEMLRADTPYPVLELIGEQGTAKSTTQTALRRVIDPNACDLRAGPKHPEDLFVSAGVNHVVSCENISHLSAPMQDALCVISTGGGYAKRKLYSDADESIIYAKNPVIINGIAPAITAQDLIDRAITIELPVINERTETTTLCLLFEREHPLILGALLDIVAKALVLLPSIKLPHDKRPRLLEFVHYGMAIAKVIGSSEEEFMLQFSESRQESIARTIEASPVASALIEWFEAQGKVMKELPAKILLNEVEKYRPANTDAWPRSAKGFADALRRIAPALRQLNIECRCLGKQGSYVKWQIFFKEN